MTSSSVLSSCVALEWHPLVPPRVRQVAPVLSAAALCEASVSSLRERKEKKRSLSRLSFSLSSRAPPLVCLAPPLLCLAPSPCALTWCPLPLGGRSGQQRGLVIIYIECYEKECHEWRNAVMWWCSALLVSSYEKKKGKRVHTKKSLWLLASARGGPACAAHPQ
jgi:hypothetical protein